MFLYITAIMSSLLPVSTVLQCSADFDFVCCVSLYIDCSDYET